MVEVIKSRFSALIFKEKKELTRPDPKLNKATRFPMRFSLGFEHKKAARPP